MRKKILSIYLAVAIGFLSVVASAIPAYASSSPEWSDYFEITYSSSDINSPYSLEFKDSKAQTAYKNLSKDERKKIDYDAFMAISAKDQNYKFGNLVFNNTTIPDLIKGIAASSGMIMSGAPDDTGFTADLQDKLTRISNSISASNRKFGGKGISRKANSTHPNNFGLGTLTLSKDFINDLRFSVAEFYNCLVYAPLPSTPKGFYTLFTLTDPYKTRYEKSFNESFNMGRRAVVVYKQAEGDYSNAYYSFCFLKSEDYIKNCTFYLNTNYLSCFETLDASPSYSVSESAFDVNLNPSYGNTFGGAGSNKIPVNGNFTILGVTGMPFVVFKTKDAALAHLKNLNGSQISNYYISTEIIDNDYSTTINKMYDYSEKNTYETINNNITQAITDKGSGLTEEEYQKIVNEVMKKVQTEIDSQPDSGDSGGSSGGGGTGGDSGNTGGGSGGDSGNTGGGESNTWLQKIYNRLGDILEKIGTVTGVDTLVSLVQQIADDVHKLKNGEAIAPDMSVTNGLLSDIAASLKTLIGVSAAGDISDLLADTVGDKISDYIGNVKNAATEMTDALQEVFPFSIPWDLMAIFGLFSAESKAPVFDIPIVVPSLGINETFHIDFSDFEYISVICRTMLGISFAVGLMWITIELTKEGD